MSIDQSTSTNTGHEPSEGGPAPARPPAAPGVTPAATPAKAGTTFESLAVAGIVFGIFAMAIAIFAVGLAARAVSDASKGGGGSGGGSAPATLDITEADFSIKPKEAEISSNGSITIDNKGAVEHDLKIENKQTALIKPGAKGELKLDGLAPGTYEMYCTVPGHRAAGMQGTIVVK